MQATDFQQALQALKQEYERNLPDKVAEIENQWRTLTDEAWDSEQFKTFIRLAHSLAGSGATYGFPQVSTAARDLERYSKALNGEMRVSPEEEAQIQARIVSLWQSIIPVEHGVAAVQSDAPSSETTPLPPCVLVYEHDSELARDIETQLGYFGYRAERIALFHNFLEQAEQTQPTALILDWDEAKQCSAEEVSRLAPLHKKNPSQPILFMSEDDDLAARLEAVQHGATAYLVKPIVLSSLLETLDAQTGSRSSEPFRILIIEDEASLASWAATVLKQAGMLTQTVTDPMRVMSALVDFRPDLILTDFHMPGVTGPELAAILRQQEAYLSIPIVFLSSETDVDKQLSAMLLGGDDFLLKPIEPPHLISSVTSSVQRARILRNLAEHDSLTGLLNHTRFKEQLAIEVARAIRTQTDLAFVMLDIDRFKSVNDIYGHPTGDRVIKSLARLLKQRLRKTDILGRYGGEEFAVILPETNGGAAYAVMEEIRTSFAQIHQHAGGVEFQVTVSGGIATLPPWLDAAELNEAADKALYQAKRNGRNQIAL